MSEKCPICKTECKDGAIACSICGFADKLGINNGGITPEGAQYWLDTVVKPYRAKWEKEKLLVQLEEANKQKAALQAELEAAKKSASLPIIMPPVRSHSRPSIQGTQPASQPTSERWERFNTKNKLVIVFFIALFAIFVIIMVKPDSAKAHFEKGNKHYNKNDYVKAIESYSEAIKLNPNEFMYLHSRGLAFYNNKNYARAIEDFQVVLQINSNYEPAKQYLANIRQIQDKLKQDEQKAKVNQQSSNFVQEREGKLQRIEQVAEQSTTVQQKTKIVKSSSSTKKSSSSVLSTKKSKPNEQTQKQVTQELELGQEIFFFTDSRDNKSYAMVPIGTQTWMIENLNYNASGSICYDNKLENCRKYGRLYNWETAKKACPSGWHLPTDAEWKQLVSFAGDKIAGKRLMSRSEKGTDDYLFSALLGGYGKLDGSFSGVSYGSYWWSSTDVDGNYAYYRSIYNNYEHVFHNRYNKSYFFSVRCLKN